MRWIAPGGNISSIPQSVGLALLMAIVPISLAAPNGHVKNGEQAKEVVQPANPLAKPVQLAQPITERPQEVLTPPPVAQPQPPASSCEAEIRKYNWRQDVALAVARAESGLNPHIVNNNPRTGDYSIGCFQINIYGANARTRPSEAELKNPSTNVAWAFKLYMGNGGSFIGQWGVCRAKVSCY